MSDDNKGADAPKTNDGLDNPSGLDSPKTPVNDDPGGDSAELVRIREALKQANAEAKTNRERLEAYKKTQLVEKEEYKTLYETAEGKVAELEITAAKAVRYEAALKATNEQRIASLPEEFHDKFNKLSIKLSPDDLSDTLDDFSPSLTRKPIPDVNAGAGGAGGKPADPSLKVTQIDLSQADEILQKGLGGGRTRDQIAASIRARRGS